MREPVDIIMLTHNRLDHLEATIDALEANTPEPYRLTIVDNASGPETRNWLSANRARFHRIIFRPTNEHLGAFDHGIAATTSDPYILTDPDLVLPSLEPSWLARLLDIMDRHPDFGLVGVGLDQANLPPVQEPERIDPATVVDGEIVEAGTGSCFTAVRRAALLTPYRTAWRTCVSVKRAGYRFGWVPEIRAVHLGWDDYKLHPGHLAAKHIHGEYREIGLIERAPTLPELALAAPAVAACRRLDVPDASLLELTWSEPAVAAAVPGAVCLTEPLTPLPLADGAAGAVILVDPPAERAEEILAEACRVAARAVVAVASLERFGGRPAAELSPAGWTGTEAHGPGDVPLALADAAARDEGLRDHLGHRTLDDREQWLSLFAAGAFGVGSRRLWIWTADDARPVPDAVQLDGASIEPWRPAPAERRAHRAGALARVKSALDLRDRARFWGARLRMRAG